MGELAEHRWHRALNVDVSSPQTNHHAMSDHIVLGLRFLTAMVFAGAFFYYITVSWGWRMAVDTPVMHYVVFLLRHGYRPYVDITDNNMPGTYLTEAAAMSVFGASDVAWRVYEFVLLGVLTAAASFNAYRWDWVAGVFGVGTFAVLHSAEGPQLAVEREFLIGVLLMTACAVLFAAVERCKPSLMLLFGVLSGVILSIKPTYLPLPPGLLLLSHLGLRRHGLRPLPYWIWAAGGVVLALGTDLLFLVHFHALAGFRFILTRVLPAYGGLGRVSLAHMLAALMPRAVLFLFAGFLLLLLLNGKRAVHRDWRWWVLAGAAGFGLLSYLAQGKGFVYHRYVFLIFLLVLAGIEIFASLRNAGPARWVAIALLAVTFTDIVPSHLREARDLVGQTSFELTLERDLTTLGTDHSLAGRVQCFDMVFGCLSALYHLRLPENTGFTGDMLLFSAQDTVASQYYRARFWQLAQQDPAEVLVVSNGIMSEPNSYGKIERWPEFAAYLQQHYRIATQRTFPEEIYGSHERHVRFSPDAADSYRLYLRDGSPLWARVDALSAKNVSVSEDETR